MNTLELCASTQAVFDTGYMGLVPTPPLGPMQLLHLAKSTCLHRNGSLKCMHLNDSTYMYHMLYTRITLMLPRAAMAMSTPKDDFTAAVYYWPPFHCWLHDELLDSLFIP